MSYFLNYNNGAVSIDTYRDANAASTDIDDIVNAFSENRNENLTASIDIWAKEQLSKIDIVGCNREDAETIIFSENDFFDKILENVFGFSMSDYPDLRDYQHDYIAEHIND